MRVKKLWPFLVVIAFLVLAGAGLAFGWGLAGEPEAKSSPVPPSPSVNPDINGRKACAMLADAKVYGAWGDHILVNNVANAAIASTDPIISITGTQLKIRLALASGAIGQPDRPERDRNLNETMEELERQCNRAGL